MPMLSNPRHESFAQGICLGLPASRAYFNAFGTSGNAAEVNGGRLLRKTQVAARIAELQARAAIKSEKDVVSLVRDLDDAIAFAKACKNPSAIVQAIALQAKLLGLMAPEQLEITHHRPAPLPTEVLELSEAEWKAQFAGEPGKRKPSALPTMCVTDEPIEATIPEIPVPALVIDDAPPGVVWLNMEGDG